MNLSDFLLGMMAGVLVLTLVVALALEMADDD